jgi:hypothetical protein
MLDEAVALVIERDSSPTVGGMTRMEKKRDFASIQFSMRLEIGKEARLCINSVFYAVRNRNHEVGKGFLYAPLLTCIMPRRYALNPC